MRRVSAVLCTLLAALVGPATAQTTNAAPSADWRQRGVCYEVFVRSFFDSDGDGVGDLGGLIQKLDYINDGDPASQRDLGASCIWLMPIMQSPSYHGYDVSNYYQVDREYGTNADFRRLVAEAHRRGIRILVDLVLNHSSSEHPYFKAALLDAASPFRDWYVWAPQAGPQGSWSVPIWHRVPGRDEFYFGLFWSGMPDLNLANPAVRAEAEEIARFWLTEMGADGFRFDAVMHFFEEGEHHRHGAQTHPWLRDYQAALRRIEPDVYTVGEVWDSIGAIRAYYPDQLDSYFIFEVADGILDAARSGTKQRFLAAVERAQREFPRGRWSPFLRNHDQTRTLTELQGDVARNRLAATLLLTLPGLPFVYYGEEIGMTGAKPDPRLRTPMHWARAPHAGFTRALPWEPLQPDSFTANVQVQDADPASLLNLHRRLIHLRAAHPALGASADFVPLATADDAALAYLRRSPEQTVLVLANLGTRRLPAPQLSAGGSVLPAGRYTARTLLGREARGTLRVGADGRAAGWSPVPALEPLETVILELARTG